MNNRNIRILMAAVTVAMMTTGVQGVSHYNDGGNWEIGYEINDSVHIDEGETYAETQTTMNIVQGGSIPRGSWPYNYLQAYNQSTVNISGGSVSLLHAFDASTVDISGGSVSGWLKAYDTSKVNISGGSVNQHFFAYSAGTVGMSDGYVDWFAAHDTSTVDMSGGTMRSLNASGSSTMNISGGSVQWLETRNSSVVQMSGGSVNWLDASNSTMAQLTGGSVYRLNARDTSTVNISGGSVDLVAVYNLHSGSEERINITSGTVGTLWASIDVVSNEHFNVAGLVSDLAGYGIQAAEGTIDNVDLSIRARNTSMVNIYDGSVYYLSAFDTSTVNIFGGLIENIGTGDSGNISYATITIVGKNFELGDGLTLVGDELFGVGRLSGQWLDGTSWQTYIALNRTTATILLIPEPATVLLLGFGGLALRRKQRR